MTHLVYSHHHADHGGAASLFGGDVVRIGHEETRRLLLRDDDPARPVPEVTFADRYTLEVGGERAELAWHGPNHSPDNIYIHFPGHDTLMFIDVVNAGWVPIYNLNLSEDVPGYMAAPAMVLSYPWTHFICGHLGRLATRDDVAVHQPYIADIEASSREALATVDPVPFYMHYGENAWAGVKAHLDAVTERRPRPSSRSTPACWPPRTSRSSPPPPRSPSCSRCASTAGPADQSTRDHTAPGPGQRRPRCGPDRRARRGRCAALTTPEIDVAYLSSLPGSCPVPGHLAAYGRMVTEAAMIRELMLPPPACPGSSRDQRPSLLGSVE